MPEPVPEPEPEPEPEGDELPGGFDPKSHRKPGETISEWVKREERNDLARSKRASATKKKK